MLGFSFELLCGFKIGLEHIDGEDIGFDGWIIVLDVGIFRFGLTKYNETLEDDE